MSRKKKETGPSTWAKPKPIPFEWETIYEFDHGDDTGGVTNRAKVFGGWLVKHISELGGSITTAMVFYPDPTHAWEVSNEPAI